MRFVRRSKMTFGPTKSGKLLNTKTHNVISANQKAASFVYRWLRTRAMFNVLCIPAFVEASDIISSVEMLIMSIHLNL